MLNTSLSNWYWEPVVEMSRKWCVVFFSTFMPTGQSQAALVIVITLVYWYLHYMHEPYRTDWKDSEGNPADPDLENNLQHYMYAIQIVMVIAMMSYESYEDNPDAGGAVLLTIYFIGVAVLVYGIAKTMQRQRNRSKMLATEDAEEEAQGKKSSSVEMVKKVFDGMGGA
jgi:cbb3-type cytochrome oxidase subunit 3